MSGSSLSIGAAMAGAILICGALMSQQPTALAVPAQAAPVADGATLFQDKGCTHCHGANGMGTDKGPSLASVGRTWSRAKIDHQVREGGVSMPAFGAVLTEPETQSLLDFLVSKKAPVKRAGKHVTQ